jgi:outer membrane protein assembly factor BamB
VTNGAIAAWKIVDKNGTPALEPGWVSRDMTSPITPVVINGVVFAASSGEFRADNNSMAAAERAFRSKPAVLYALDGANGKALWNSGDAIKSFATGGALSAGGSTVYLTAFDGTLYAFGFPIEH